MATNVSASKSLLARATLRSTSAWRASSFPLERIDPGVVADGPSDRCSWWRYRRIASYEFNLAATSPMRLQSSRPKGIVFTVRATVIRRGSGGQ